MSKRNGSKSATMTAKERRGYVATIKQQSRELEVLSALCVKQRAMLSKIPGDPKRLAKTIFDRYNAAGRDELIAELIRLAELEPWPK